MAGARVHDELLALAQHDHETSRVDERAPALSDQLKHVLERDLSADRHGHVTGRLEAAYRLLGLPAASLARLIHPRVVDRNRGPHGEDHHRVLVALTELPVLLLGQIQVAPGLATDHDRNPQEAVHRGLSVRAAVADGLRADVLQAAW